jgi:dinuclear metal center YbgI/SA1388 family protein
MPVTSQMIIDKMEEAAPAKLALEWDNIGLLTGDPSEIIHKIIVTLDVTKETVEKACKTEKTMIISHHPLILKAINSIRRDMPQGKLIASIIKNDVAVYSSHTNMDIAKDGINDILAGKLGLLNTVPLEKTFREKLYKIIVFVPENHLETVRQAMTSEGAGHIGNYSGCTFDTAGTGAFLPLAGANPYIGTTGQIEYVNERRLETVVSESLKKKVIAAMLKAHPYEEVAYDEILLENPGKSYGLGRVGDLAKPVSVDEFINLVKSVLKISHVNIAGKKDKNIARAAVCGGSGAGLAHCAAVLGADIFVTGDVKYHEAQAALDAGLIIVDAGHFPTENIFVPHVVNYLKKCASENNWDIKIEGMIETQNIFSVY